MTLSHVRTSELEIAYLEAGTRDGRPVLLLHGFPDDATCWTEVMTSLASRGCWCVAPYIRGVGPTVFLNRDTPRAGDFAALGTDVLELMESLDLRDTVVVGQDWGSPAAEIAAVFAPARVSRLVKLNWYGLYTMAELARSPGFAYGQLRTLWYVWMLNTPLGEMMITHDRIGLARALWAEWSPSWECGQRHAALARVEFSFANPDFARVVLSAYRAGITASERNPDHEPLRARLVDPPSVECETLVLRGADDGVERTPLAPDAVTRYFARPVQEYVLTGVGHFPQREQPDAVIRAILG